MTALRMNEVPIRRLFDIVNGATPASGDADCWGGEVLWATPEDFGRANGVIESTQRTLTKRGYESCGTTMVPPGSLVLTTRAPIGNVAITAEPLCTNQGCKSLVPRGDINTKFFYYVLLDAAVQLQALGQGSTFRELSSDKLASFPVPYPSAETQRTIAAFLDRKTAAIDELIAKKERLIELLQEKRQALVTSAIFGEKMNRLRLSDLARDLRAGWRLEPAWAHLRPVKEQGHADLTLLSVYRDHGVIPKNSRDDNYNRPGENLSVYQRVLRGDVVMNKMKAWQGSIAVSQFEGIVSPDYQVLRPSSKALTTGFLHLLLRSTPYISEYAARAYGVRPDQWRLMLDNFRTIPLLIPPAEMQAEVARRVHASLQSEAAVMNTIEIQIERLSEYRRTLISYAVAGKLPIADEDAA